MDTEISPVVFVGANKLDSIFNDPADTGIISINSHFQLVGIFTRITGLRLVSGVR